MTGTQRPRVALVILTWNGRAELERAIPSLAQVEYEPRTTIVVDNGSSDGSAEFVRSRFPQVDLLALERNHGFATGMNVGARRALELGADYVLFLNHDIEVDREFVAALVDEARRRPDAGALCPKIMLADRPDRIWYAGASLDPRRGYNGAHRGFNEPDSARYGDVVETGRACGCAMLVPRPVLEKVGLFDDDLFTYVEDTDWSLRARDAGYRILVVPRSRIWHAVSAAAGGEGSPRTLYYGTRNTLHVLERRAPLGTVGTWRRRAVVLASHGAQALLTRR
ncbi:MAG: glycosyltransferase family 2 protein, partial [Actinomycetota bacterium]|nr:glycosyltransferase family 2 protein [Actinomycetota bacterium]